MRPGRAHLALAALVLTAAGCGSTVAEVAVPGGDADRGAQLVQAYGCGACHTIAGIRGADAKATGSLLDMNDGL